MAIEALEGIDILREMYVQLYIVSLCLRAPENIQP